MKSVPGKDFISVLEQPGWRVLRINGSHHACGKTGDPSRISFPVHGNRPIKEGLLLYFLKLAGLTEDDL
ncbi:MAG: type II toxin-antitoxin system HicA family toxin [Candidatus Omnitrophica bacterium]|nr:type II toxin-antitoxin system HicA family toxin [Candidatus Omnitrophota bacterium]